MSLFFFTDFSSGLAGNCLCDFFGLIFEIVLKWNSFYFCLGMACLFVVFMLLGFLGIL